MEKTYFKNIFSYLSHLYPNTNVYAISDEHFYHQNIINYTRSEFNSVEEMNDTLVRIHNETVGPNDIVIFLGDFCMRNSKIAEIASRLNGHKFLVMGNHDQEKFLKNYRELGFENVFITPIAFENSVLSHEPIMDDTKKDVLLLLMKKEFCKNRDYFNYHGHIHDNTDFERSRNVTSELIKYRPILLGKTSSEKSDEILPLIADNDAFNKVVDTLASTCHVEKELLITDYIYSMMVEYAKDYEDAMLFSGSFPAFKKYGLITRMSDLDASILYDPGRSKKFNTEVLKGASESVFMALNKVPTFNVTYDKRMSGMYILSNYFNNGHFHKQTYFDLNAIYRDVYKDSDYYTFEGASFIEHLALKEGIDIEGYELPKFSMNTLTPSGDLANMLLQYLFQDAGSEQTKKVLKKIKYICHYVPVNKINYKEFEDQIIRFFIRNIYFFDMTNRRREIHSLFDREINIKLEFLCNYIPVEYINLFYSIFSASEFMYAYHYLGESGNVVAASDEIVYERMKR